MDDQRHDVFICFRGDEPFGTSTIRTAIVEPLFDSLTGIGASVFMDDESIESGQPIPDTILQGILRTRGGGAALILVSPDFFSRVWPLIEMACFYQAQHYPDQDQIHLFVVCLNVTPEDIKQAAFVREKCPGVKELKFVVAPAHIRCDESTQVVKWLSETVLFWIKSNCVALGRTRTKSFNFFNARLSQLLNQREVLETIAIQLGLFQLSFPKDPCSFFDLLAAANKVNMLTEGHIMDFQQALSGFNLDGKFCDVTQAALKFVERYNKKWLNRKTIDQVPPLQERRSEIEEWFKSPSRLHLDTNNSVLQAVFSPPDLAHTKSMTSNSSTKPPSTLAVHNFQPVGQVDNFDLSRSCHAAGMSSEQKEGSYLATISAFYFCWKNNFPQGYFGTGSLYLIFPQNVDLPSIHNSPNVKIVQVDPGVELEVDATNTWSWPLTLDEHGVLNDTVRNNLALLIASFGLEGVCRFRVHQILSSEDNDRYAVFFMPSERDIQTARSIVEQEGFMENFEQAYNTSDTTAKDQVAFCGGCGVVQRTSPDNPYLCRLGHLQAVNILDQPIPSEKAVEVNFEWMPHNLDRRVDLLISCEQDDEIVSSLKDDFLRDTYSVITSENRDMSSFLQAILSTRGGGIALVLMTKNYMIQSRTISELACLYEVRQDIRLIIACVGTTKSQVLQNVIIQELCPDVSSHLFLECGSDDSVDNFLKNKISQELLQHVIPGFRRDQSYLILKDRLAACFANSPGRVFAKIAIKLDLESNSVMNWSDLFKQAELHGKFGEEQIDQLQRAILTLSETELNSSHRTAALKIIQQYEKKWLADWTSKEVPALDKIDERAHLVNSRFRAPLYKTLTGHTDTVRSIAFSPNSKLIASASADCTVRLWNLPSGGLNAELKGHMNLVLSVAFSPDGKSIVTGSGDNSVRTWSIATNQLLKMLNGHSKEVNSVAWSPNSKLIASGSTDKTVILWDATSGSVKKKLTDHTSYVVSVSFSQSGNKLVSAGYDNTTIIWYVNSGAALITLAHSDTVLCTCFSHDDQFVVTGCNDGIVRMFNADTGHEEKRFVSHTDSVRSVACLFDGSIIASGSNDKSVRLWDVASTKLLQQLDGHTLSVVSIAFSRDGKFIASASDDNTVRLWNTPSSLQLRQIEMLSVAKAIRANRVVLKRANLFVLGDSEAGKTSLVDAFQGNYDKVVPDRPRTDTFDESSVAVEIVSSGQHKFAAVKDVLRPVIVSLSKATVLPSVQPISSVTSISTLPYDPEDSSSLKPVPIQPATVSKNNEEEKKHALNDLVVSKVVEQSRNELHVPQDGEHMLVISDFAGREEYRHVHPVFLQRPGLFIVCFNIKLAFDRNKISQASLDEFITESIDFWLFSILTFARVKDTQDGINSIFLVATHIDQVYDSFWFSPDQHTAYFIQQLQTKLCDRYKRISSLWERLYHDATSNNVFLRIDSTNQLESISQLPLLRNHIFNRLDSMSAEYPAEWLKLEYRIRTLSESFIGVNELLERINKERWVLSTRGGTDVSHEELTDALRYLAQLGTILYFDDLPGEQQSGLSQLVIRSTNFVVKQLQFVINLPNRLAAIYRNTAPPQPDFNRMLNEGRISTKLLAFIQSRIQADNSDLGLDKASHDLLPNLLLRFQLCFEQKNEEERLLWCPALFKPLTKRNKGENAKLFWNRTVELLFSSKLIEPTDVSFWLEIECVPQGLFTRLLSHVMSTWPNARHQNLYREQAEIKACIDGVFATVVFACVGHKLIQVFVKSTTVNMILPFYKIRQLTENAVDTIRKRWYPNLTWNIGIWQQNCLLPFEIADKAWLGQSETEVYCRVNFDLRLFKQWLPSRDIQPISSSSSQVNIEEQRDVLTQKRTFLLHRYGLVIGNSYNRDDELRTVPNDIRLVVDCLNNVDIPTSVLLNGTLDEIIEAMHNWANSFIISPEEQQIKSTDRYKPATQRHVTELKNNRMLDKSNFQIDEADALFFMYFTGHGEQHNGTMYIIPEDSPTDYSKWYSIPALLDQLSAAFELVPLTKVSVVIMIDACRANKHSKDLFTSVSNLTVTGFELHLIFSTQSSEFASAGTRSDRYGPFAEGLSRALQKGVSLDDVVRSVTKFVESKTTNEQHPIDVRLAKNKVVF